MGNRVEHNKSLTITHKRNAKDRLPNIHPGEIIREEFLKPVFDSLPS
jgi:hypothetical protein